MPIAAPREKLDAILARHDIVRRPAVMRAGSPRPSSPCRASWRSSIRSSARMRAYRAAQDELAGLEACSPIRRPMPRCARSPRTSAPRLEERAARRRRSEVRLMLLPKDAADEKSAILEVRAGTGGDEAALFAGDLFRMYPRYAELKGWKVEILSESEGTAGGYKEIVAEINGRGVFARLKFESGVHRVQRVPATETQRAHPHLRRHGGGAAGGRGGRRRRSTTTDLQIDTMRAQGAGGQHVNKTESRDPHHASARPASSCSCRRSARSTRTGPRPWRCCAPGSTTWSAARKDSARAADRKLAGRLRRPLGAHPHLQLPAGRGSPTTAST